MAFQFARLTVGVPELYLNMPADHELEAARRRFGQPANRANG
jgi:hypothetical protein